MNELWAECHSSLLSGVHALCLQLVANGIVDLAISEAAHHNIGTDKLNVDTVVMRLGVSEDNIPVFLDDTKWKGMTFVESATKPTKCESVIALFLWFIYYTHSIFSASKHKCFVSKVTWSLTASKSILARHFKPLPENLATILHLCMEVLHCHSDQLQFPLISS